MLNLPPSVRIFLCTQPADMRRSFDGLSMMVEQILRVSPFSGHLFVFINKRADRVKILYWDRSGFAIFYKRLEEGTFGLPRYETGRQSIEMEATELAMLLEGIELVGIRRRPRYHRQVSQGAPSV